MRRVSVVGSAGAGKTTFSRALGEALRVPAIELDAIFHLPDWGELPDAEFVAAVAARTTGEGWVVDGNYSTVREVVWARADTVVFLDYSRARVMTRLIPRTVRRLATREELWNGNREPWSNVLSLDPQRSIVAWAWTRHRVSRARFAAAAADPRRAHLRFVRLRSPREASELLAGLRRG